MKFKGFILFKTDYKDNDEIINVLSESSEIKTILCRGVKRINSKNKRALNVLNFVEFNTLMKGDLHILKNCEVIEDNFELLTNFSLSASYLFISELLTKSDDELSPETFNEYREMISNNQIKYSSILKIILQFADSGGVMPISGLCTKCNSSENISYFRLKDHGFICQKCAKRKMNVDTLHNLYYFIRTKKFIKDFDTIEAVHLIKTIVNDISDVLGVKLNSSNYFINQLPNIGL